MKQILTEEQINLGAMHFAATNTGLVNDRGDFPMPKSKRDVRMNFNRISYEYECNMGEGLGEELEMWKLDLKQIIYPESTVYQLLKKEVPFIFEEVK